jgi:hypothetical protein
VGKEKGLKTTAIPSPLCFFPERIYDVDVIDESSSLEFATKVLKQCRYLHDCGGWSIVTLPAMVISVGSNDDDVKLIRSANQEGQYTSLSHCWGEMHPLRTVRATLESHLESIPFHVLPRTFQDAI